VSIPSTFNAIEASRIRQHIRGFRQSKALNLIESAPVGGVVLSIARICSELNRENVASRNAARENV
jgi:hypothetical protein